MEMMDINITTSETENRFKEIIVAYIDFFQNSEILSRNYIELKLILLKIGSNLQAANLLWSRNGFNDAKIILRSAFESLVLFEVLTTFPHKINKYKDENEIIRFQNNYGFYKRGLLSYEELVSCYNELNETIRVQIPFENISEVGLITYDINKLEKFFVNDFKTLSQQVHKMMRELKQANNPHAARIWDYSILPYSIGSQITHSSFGSLLEAFGSRLSTEELLKEIKQCFGDSIFIIAITMDTLKTFVGLKDENLVWKKTALFYEYLGCDLSLFKTKNEISPNIIDVITFS